MLCADGAALPSRRVEGGGRLSSVKIMGLMSRAVWKGLAFLSIRDLPHLKKIDLGVWSNLVWDLSSPGDLAHCQQHLWKINLAAEQQAKQFTGCKILNLFYHSCLEFARRGRHCHEHSGSLAWENPKSIQNHRFLEGTLDNPNPSAIYLLKKETEICRNLHLQTTQKVCRQIQIVKINHCTASQKFS